MNENVAIDNWPLMASLTTRLLSAYLGRQSIAANSVATWPKCQLTTSTANNF